MPNRPQPKIDGLSSPEQDEIDRLAATFQTEDADLTLAVQCTQCGQPVTLVLTSWPPFLNGVTLTAADPPRSFVQRWTCPHCDQPNEGGFPGRMTLARKGHDKPA